MSHCYAAKFRTHCKVHFALDISSTPSQKSWILHGGFYKAPPLTLVEPGIYPRWSGLACSSLKGYPGESIEGWSQYGRLLFLSIFLTLNSDINGNWNVTYRFLQSQARVCYGDYQFQSPAIYRKSQLHLFPLFEGRSIFDNEWASSHTWNQPRFLRSLKWSLDLGNHLKISNI